MANPSSIHNIPYDPPEHTRNNLSAEPGVNLNPEYAGCGPKSKASKKKKVGGGGGTHHNEHNETYYFHC